MALVEQAIYTSAETDRSAGYQVVAQSPGICEADSRELAIWGPSHDSLLELGPDAASLNFHPLPSGAYCVSRTVPAGWEYSGRGGHRVYTHCLVVPPEVLQRFANNPFALLRAALAGGAMELRDEVPRRLEPLLLAGGAALVDQALLAQLASDPGADPMALLVHTALGASCLAVAGSPSTAQLIAGLLNCLPLECRTAFSFSTGLKFSPRRPFRMVAISGDKSEQRWIAHQPNVTVLDLSSAASAGFKPVDGWARLVGRVLASGRTSLLAAELSKRRFHLTLDDLPALALQLMEDLDATQLRTDYACNDRHLDAPVSPRAETSPDPASADAMPADPAPADSMSSRSSALQHAHAAHRRFEKSVAAEVEASARVEAPSQMLESLSMRAMEMLEQLDDVVYDAINGRAASLEELETLWPKVLEELGEPAVAESREQYLRYALAIWDNCTQSGCVRNASRAVQALDVLCVLFGDD